MADSVYWTNFTDSAVRVAPLAGGGNVDTVYGLGQGALGPRGVAIDAAAGRIYWANYGGGSIRAAPLAGGLVDTLQGPGPVVRVPWGVAIDPVTGRIYWANETDNAIRRAALAGGGNADILYQGQTRVNAPTGVAIDRAAGTIYWANGGDNSIRRAPLAGGGAVDVLYGPADGVSGPMGVAIDRAAGRIYWANYKDNSIRGASLAGGSAVDTLYRSADGVSAPMGVAIDPTAVVGRLVRTRHDATSSRLEVWVGTVVGWLVNWLDKLGLIRGSVGRMYWANNGDDTIRSAPLAGGGIVDTLYSGSGRGVYGPSFLALLRAPLATGAPVISGSGRLGQALACAPGAWATDLVGSSLSRAPQSYAYQWKLGGADIGGATLAWHTPTAAGSYTCVVTATNQAGSTAQMSAAVAVS